MSPRFTKLQCVSLTHHSLGLTHTVTVLHPKYKKFYFIHRKWPKEWITTVVDLAREAWRRFKARNTATTQSADPPTPSANGAPAKKSSGISFDVNIDYALAGAVSLEEEDELDRYLHLPPTKDCMDPIQYWSQRKQAGIDPLFAQFALNYLSAPGMYL